MIYSISRRNERGDLVEGLGPYKEKNAKFERDFQHQMQIAEAHNASRHFGSGGGGRHMVYVGVKA